LDELRDLGLRSSVTVVKPKSLVLTACLVLVLGALGCGGDEKEKSARGDPITGDALETCLTDEGLDVERGEPGPIQIPPAGTFTPEAILVEAGDSFPRSEMLVFEPRDVASFDRRLPPGWKDEYRFGASVLVLVTEVGRPGPVRLPKVPADVSRALDACVS
jgi:hypothetical protein